METSLLRGVRLYRMSWGKRACRWFLVVPRWIRKNEQNYPTVCYVCSKQGIVLLLLASRPKVASVLNSLGGVNNSASCECFMFWLASLLLVRCCWQRPLTHYRNPWGRTFILTKNTMYVYALCISRPGGTCRSTSISMLCACRLAPNLMLRVHALPRQPGLLRPSNLGQVLR